MVEAMIMIIFQQDEQPGLLELFSGRMAPDDLMEIDNDATMTDNIKESDPFIDLLKGIFDTNNDLSRVEMFSVSQECIVQC